MEDRSFDHLRWDRLMPAEFLCRQKECPVVYLPMGLCEPHGHIAPFGLDTIKAEWLCRNAADRFGGIIAPTMTYHIHEIGYHAPWLEGVMGGVNPRLAALPPHLVLETLLYQLRAFYNAGFRSVVVISGHHGAQEDLRMVAEAFSEAYHFPHFVRTDPELVAGSFAGDHAGKYEISQLLAIRPDLIDLQRANRELTHSLGRFAQNPDVLEATAEEGRAILDLCIERIGEAGQSFPKDLPSNHKFLSFEDMETIWTALASNRSTWAALNL